MSERRRSVAGNAVANAALQIRTMSRQLSLAHASAIGDTIVRHLFDGNPTTSRDDEEHVIDSLLQIAGHPACPLDAAALHQALVVSSIIETHPRLLTFTQLEARHLAAVSHLPEAEQLQWLELAENKQLEADELLVLLAENTAAESTGRAVQEKLGRLSDTVAELCSMTEPLPRHEREALVQRLSELQSLVSDELGPHSRVVRLQVPAKQGSRRRRS